MVLKTYLTVNFERAAPYNGASNLKNFQINFFSGQLVDMLKSCLLVITRCNIAHSLPRQL